MSNDKNLDRRISSSWSCSAHDRNVILECLDTQESLFAAFQNSARIIKHTLEKSNCSAVIPRIPISERLDFTKSLVTPTPIVRNIEPKPTGPVRNRLELNHNIPKKLTEEVSCYYQIQGLPERLHPLKLKRYLDLAFGSLFSTRTDCPKIYIRKAHVATNASARVQSYYAETHVWMLSKIASLLSDRIPSVHISHITEDQFQASSNRSQPIGPTNSSGPVPVPAPQPESRLHPPLARTPSTSSSTGLLTGSSNPPSRQNSEGQGATTSAPPNSRDTRLSLPSDSRGRSSLRDSFGRPRSRHSSVRRSSTQDLSTLASPPPVQPRHNTTPRSTRREGRGGMLEGTDFPYVPVHDHWHDENFRRKFAIPHSVLPNYLTFGTEALEDVFRSKRQPFNIINVRGDGSCGLRALAVLLFDNEDKYLDVWHKGKSYWRSPRNQTQFMDYIVAHHLIGTEQDTRASTIGYINNHFQDDTNGPFVQVDLILLQLYATVFKQDIVVYSNYGTELANLRGSRNQNWSTPLTLALREECTTPLLTSDYQFIWNSEHTQAQVIPDGHFWAVKFQRRQVSSGNVRGK